MTATPGSSQVPDAQAAITSLTKYQAPGENSASDRLGDLLRRRSGEPDDCGADVDIFHAGLAERLAESVSNRGGGRLRADGIDVRRATVAEVDLERVERQHGRDRLGRSPVDSGDVPPAGRAGTVQERSRDVHQAREHGAGGSYRRRLCRQPSLGRRLPWFAGCPRRRSPTGSTAGGRVKGKVPSVEPKRTGPRRPSIRLKPDRRWWKLLPALLGALPDPPDRLGARELLPVPGRRLGREQAARPRVRQALDDQHGSATDILLLGTDHAQLSGRESANRSDSITLVRVDTDKHRIAYLSIPRDLVAEIPGYGTAKINAAMQLGGAALAVRTVRELTGLPVNHVAIVDFSQFEKLIDKLGGHRHRRPETDHLQVRLPVPDRGALRAVGGLALREGQAAHGRAPRADLLARPEEQARSRRHRLLARGAQPAGAAGGRRRS